MGGDFWACLFIAKFLLFQSTPPHGRRPLAFFHCQRHVKFQSTPLQERGDGGIRPRLYTIRCFNPRLHMGGDSVKIPIWMADQLFQSTPLLEGQLILSSSDSASSGFQSTPPRGRRHSVISDMQTDGIGFNPRLPRGRRRSQPTATGAAALFQSTPPHGSDHRRDTQPTKPMCFNPRPHMGGDSYFFTVYCIKSFPRRLRHLEGLQCQ